MAGVGAAAVFTRDVEAGPTALIAIGAVLLVMSVTGSPITRAKFGDNEVTLAARREAVATIAASDPDQVVPALAVMEAYDPESVRSSGVKEIAQSKLNMRNFEQRMTRVLLSEYGSKLQVEPRSNDIALDFVVEHSGQEIVVEWVYSRHETMRYELLKNGVQRILDSEYSVGLLVSNVPVPDGMREREIARAARFNKRVQILVVDHHLSDPQALLEALKELAET
jgi:hypothetical protein